MEEKKWYTFIEAVMKSNVGTVITNQGWIADCRGICSDGKIYPLTVPIMDFDRQLIEEGIKCRPLNTSETSIVRAFEMEEY
jgi:hypothetical protein